jgi:UPF0755 protein
MSRRGRRGTDGAQDGGSWLPDEYGEDEDAYPAQDSYQQSAEPSGPPWETGGWQADPSWAPPGRPEPDWQGQPSGPLPPESHPSGPLPPLPGTGHEWRDEPASVDDRYPANGYADGGHQDAGYPGQEYPAGGYPADEYPAGYAGGDPPGAGTGGFPAGGDYQTGGFPAAGDYQTGGFAGGDYRSEGFPAGDYQGGHYPADAPAGDYPAEDYATGGYPAAADYAGSGFGEPGHQRDYAAGGFAPGEAEDGYPAPGGPYQDDPDAPGYAGRDTGNHPGYPDRGGWYGDVDEQQVWADEGEADSGFLPGLADEGGARRRDGGRPGRGRSAGRSVKKRKRGGMRRIMPRLFLTLLLLAVLGGAGYGYHLYRTYISPPDYPGAGNGSVVVRVSAGDTAAAIGALLLQKGVVASARAFSNAAKASPQGNALEPGYYRLHLHMKASLAFGLLLKPSSRVTFRVVVPEGWRLSRIIPTLGKATGNPAGYQTAIKNIAALGLPPYAKGNPEGYLFPATYTIQPGTPPAQVLKAMVARFGQEAASVNLPAVARQHQISEHDVIVVASLIQAEGGRLQDFPKIARVIYNRLYVARMQLQLDSTVMYALHTYGILASTQQLNVNSPYNTYRHFGLPPGPIDSPGDAAIQAALHPAAGPWLYFVTVDPKTGVTQFTSDPNVFAQLRAQLQQNIAHGK